MPAVVPVINTRLPSRDNDRSVCVLLDHHSSASTDHAMMKKVALALVVVLLCTEVMLTEAQIRPPGKGTNPANRRKPKPVKCGDKFCQPHQRCESGLIPVPTCY
ncbi:uncharacterized protein LOC142790004 [Rhipicephalus microplus]|uniref:uncharacterized protein LOC142790004 n=1 Tax=Rhipicephalus microplus TaxID=6941 RepID=UPI003F6AAD0D